MHYLEVTQIVYDKEILMVVSFHNIYCKIGHFAYKIVSDHNKE